MFPYHTNENRLYTHIGTDRRVNAECPEFKQVQVSDKIFCMQ